MPSAEIREKFLKFFESKGHTRVPSASLVPEGDSSVLFTTAGMQQFKPYYIGKKDALTDFGSKNTVSVQKSVRTSDIEEVGDERHLTFFEMLGNFSFGGYWKEDAITYAHEFVTKVMNLKIDYVTVFEGEEGVPEDTESAEIWKSIDPNIVIKKFGREDNFWGPTGEEGPCGPTTEIYVNGIEIWNIVFNEFYQSKDKTLKPLEVKGIDTGMGLERLTMVSQNVPTVFDTDLFDFANNPKTKEERIIADHVKASVMMTADGITPSNTERGYILRRLIRRAVRYMNMLKPDASKDIDLIAREVINRYKDSYPILNINRQIILDEILQEEARFRITLTRGIKEFEKMATSKITGKQAFILFSTYGFPIEMTIELAKEKNIEVETQGFIEEMFLHQNISRAGAEQKFKGGLAGHSDIEVKYHTATHLLHQALHDVLGDEVGQKGSNITPERLRFDFSFPRKLTDGEKERIEEIVNNKIQEALPVQNITLPKAEAEKLGARHFFDQKYPEEVSVYYIGDTLPNAYSKEFCGGPHVKNVSELGKFKIIKEEAVAAGVRRIKAVLE